MGERSISRSSSVRRRGEISSPVWVEQRTGESEGTESDRPEDRTVLPSSLPVPVYSTQRAVPRRVSSRALYEGPGEVFQAIRSDFSFHVRTENAAEAAEPDDIYGSETQCENQHYPERNR